MPKTIIILTLIFVLLEAKYIRNDTQEFVIDTRSGLIWQDDSDSKNLTKNWSSALSYCSSKSSGGYSDWRLPNYNELYMLSDTSRSNPAIDSVFLNVSTYYWSSTSYAVSSDRAWLVYFTNGSDAALVKTDLNNVRCVRSSN